MNKTILTLLTCLFFSFTMAQNAEMNFLNEIVRIEGMGTKEAAKLRGVAFATFIEERTKEVGNFDAIKSNVFQIFSNFVNYEATTAVYAYAHIKDKNQANWLLENLPTNDVNMDVLRKAIANYAPTNDQFKSLLPAEGTGFQGTWKVLYTELHKLQQSYQSYYTNPNNAKFAEAEQLIAQQKYADARAKLEELDQANFPQGSYYLGLIHINGLGTVKDLTKGFALIKKAADLNVPEANHLVSEYYAMGRGTECNPDQSLAYHKRALSLNDKSALYIEELKRQGEKAGRDLYLRALETKDPLQRKRLLQQSALNYFPLAFEELMRIDWEKTYTISEQFFWSVLGSLIREPQSLMDYSSFTNFDFQLMLAISGVRFNYENINIGALATDVANNILQDKARTEEALDWYLIAEHLGDKECYYFLGTIYLDEKGQFYDKVKGVKYMTLAAENGNELAKFQLDLVK